MHCVSCNQHNPSITRSNCGAALGFSEKSSINHFVRTSKHQPFLFSLFAIRSQTRLRPLQLLTCSVLESLGDKQTSPTTPHWCQLCVCTSLLPSPKHSPQPLHSFSIAIHRSSLRDFHQLLALFESPTEEIKIAASLALGNVAVGNMHKLVPLILEKISTCVEIQYLLLHSLKEVFEMRVAL